MALTLLCRQERLDAGLSLALALSLGQPVTGPERTGRKQADTRFKPGQSGNPDGRPKGARNTTTLALEALLDGQANALTQKAIDLALTGDMAALRLCLDRILPPRKDRPVMFTLPEIKSAQDAAGVVSAVLTAVATGEITPADAAEIGKLIDSYVKAYETAELAERLERLERMTGQ
jgi:hypothetical protein